MNEAEKHELAELVASAVIRANAAARNDCSLGIDAATARELISFAETWKCCRRFMLAGVIAAAVGGVMAALWSGIRMALRR